MCGIAGIVDLKAERAIDERALQRMANAIAHRGPDGDGFFIEPGIGFAHRRLAIIDLAGGAQPFQTGDGDGVMTYNGEIYNFRDLADDLRQQGVSLRTRSDTEVAIEGITRHGASFVEKLNGMFAIGAWRKSTRELLLARDRIGEKPLYYGETADGFLVFASEIGAMIASGFFQRELNAEAVSDYFLYGYVPDPKSIYRGIHKLAPGSILSTTRGGAVTLRRYWRPSFGGDNATSLAENEATCLEQIDFAVDRQMMSDVPLGAFLSGGVDSSAIVASMSLAGGAVKACTIGFDHEAFDERPYARDVAQRYGAQHIEEEITLDAASLIGRVANVYGEPFADTSALPTYLVCEAARRHVTVALSGDGGDELFAGYRRYPFFIGEEKARSIAPLGFRRATFGAAGKLYPKLDWAPRFLRAKTTLQSLGDDQASAYARAVAINLPDRVDAMLSSEFKASLDGYSSVNVVRDIMDATPSGDALTTAQQVDFDTWLPGRMLTKVDRASMAHGLEVRAPFLDHRLVDWANSLPSTMKLNGGVGKFVLKKALEPRLSKDILYRQKQGFGLPVRDWLRSAGGPLDRLRDTTAWRKCGILNADRITRMADAHRSGASDFSQELWSVIMFDAFLSNETTST